MPDSFSKKGKLRGCLFPKPCNGRFVPSPPSKCQYLRYARLNASYRNKVKAPAYLKASPNFFLRPCSRKSTLTVRKSLFFPVLNITEATVETLVLWYPRLFYQQPSAQRLWSIHMPCGSKLLPRNSWLTFTPPAPPCFSAPDQKQHEELPFSPGPRGGRRYALGIDLSLQLARALRADARAGEPLLSAPLSGRAVR